MNNKDFDGDALNVIILNDNLLVDEFSTLEAHYNVPDLSKPYSISGNLGLLSSVTGIVSNYIDTVDTDIDTVNDSVNKQLNRVTVEV